MQRLMLVVATAMSLGLITVFADSQTYQPKIMGPSEEGLKALQRIRVPTGTEATLVAAEPLLANPVAFCFDEQGRIYVAETFRLHAGVSDNRDQKQKNWLEADLACRTVAERDAMYKKYLGAEYPRWGTEHDRVRLL